MYIDHPQENPMKENILRIAPYLCFVAAIGLSVSFSSTALAKSSKGCRVSLTTDSGKKIVDRKKLTEFRLSTKDAMRECKKVIDRAVTRSLLSDTCKKAGAGSLSVSYIIKNNSGKDTVETKSFKCAATGQICTPKVSAYTHKCRAKDPRGGYFDSCKGRKKVDKNFSTGRFSDGKQCKAYCDKAHAEIIKAVSTKTCKSGQAVYSRLFCNSSFRNLYKGKNTETGTTHYKMTRCK